MRNALRLVIPVLVTCVLAAAGLAATYAVTAPKIAEQDRLAEERSLQAVLPDATFTCLEDSRIQADVDAVAAPVDVLDTFYATADGAHAGWALKVSSRGYGGPMVVVIGLDTSGSVTGVTILSHNETPGLGTKVITETWFLEQFPDLEAGFGDADVRALDTISGSTKSSNGVRNAVAGAGRVFSEVLSGLDLSGLEGGSQ
ncbi:MAG: FMN-binding protein [Coriobacteriia bacterium]|nr:FMN-binding protein [Coriobacteriia bacterium]